MPLTLRAVSLNDVPLTQPISARFDPAGGTIGRADSNTMALPDPERHISRQQAQVVVVSNGYSIRNVGSANPILVGKQSLLQGESAPLGDRDQVRIGGYLLEVFEEVEDATQVRTFAAPSSSTDAALQEARPRAGAANKASNVIGEFNTPLSDTNPFANLLGGAAPAPALPAPPIPAPRPVQAPVPAAARLPDDFDPFAEPAPAPIDPIDAHAKGSGLFDDLVPSAPSRSIDDLFGLNAAGTRDSLAAFVSEAPGPGVAGPAQPVASTDPLAMFDGPSATPRTMPHGPTASNHVPELNAEFRPPRPRASSPALAPAPIESRAMSTAAPIDPPRDLSRPSARSEESTAAFASSSAASPAASATRLPSPVSTSKVATGSPQARADAQADAPAAADAADAAGLIAAFCRGAGIRLDRGLDVATMETIGAMLRGSVEGVMQLIAVRAATRQELHAQITVIRPRDNNPLKFSPDAEAALEQMLAPPIRGFLGGSSAMVDAMNDLVGHAIGTMAGTRAALDGVLERFAPGELEARLERKSLLDSVLSMNRRAKLWDLYVLHYGAIHDEAQEDFHALFGKAFMAAYEEQLERLRGEKTPSFD